MQDMMTSCDCNLFVDIRMQNLYSRSTSWALWEFVS
jgi:hypothetical protein